MSRLFGTDGIRGVANEEPLTPEFAYRLGRELGATLRAERGAHRPRVVIGRDTRRSGPLLESAMAAGLLSAGADCFAVGVLPTPGIALLTRGLDAHGGIVLSASHNPFADNGIKLFSAEGTKLPDAWEEQIEARLQGADVAPRARGASIGRLVTYERAERYYVDFLVPGVLGVEYAPFSTQTTPRAGQPFTVRGIALDRGLTIENIERRQRLRMDLEDAFRSYEQDSRLLSGLDRFAQQAHDILTSPRCRRAFDLLHGAPLPAEHGFPTRLVVPGYYGTNGVKWLWRLHLAAHRLPGTTPPQNAAGARAVARTRQEDRAGDGRRRD